MKKFAAALVLAGAALSSHAATVGWTFKGTAYDSSDQLAPFWVYVEIDTGRMRNGPHFDGPGSAFGMTSFQWGMGSKKAGCSGGEYSRYTASSTGFQISSLDSSNDCSVVAWITAPGTGHYEIQDDPLTQRYDMSGPDVQFTIYFTNSCCAYQAVTLDYTYQMIPEPSPVALIGAGLAGLFWVRRRKDTREPA